MEKGKRRHVVEITPERRPIYGLTGVIGRDGVLTPEKQQRLDQLQFEATVGVMDRISRIQPGDKYPLVHMATGIGKGKIIHEVIRKQKELKPDSRILVIVGTKNVLLKQTHKALSDYQRGVVSKGGNGTYVESEDSDNENLEIDESEIERDEFRGYTVGKYGQKGVDVELATIQRITFQNSKGKLALEDYDIVIVDEVHNAGTRQRVDAIGRFSKVAGFTATPYRYSGIMKDPAQYGFEVVTSYTLPEAQEEELLPPLYGLQLNTSELVDEIPITSTGKIDFRALEQILKNSPDLRPYIVDKLAPLITLDGKHYKTVIAVNYVWEAQEIAELLKVKGIKVGLAINQQAAKQIDSEDIPALDSIERYSLPEDDPKSIQVLVSPYVASEGFDAPWTEFLVWASPTDSPLRYTQYTGRLGRRNNGKAYGVVIDCLYQTSQFDWTYNFGMWMKGHVRELENGMLYLGPMRLIPDMSAIQRMQALTPHHNLQDLQRGEILYLQESDFALTQSSFTEIFRGEYVTDARLKRIADEVVERLRIEKPKLFVRRNPSNPVPAFANRVLLIEEMLKAGAELRDKDIEDLREEDFSLTRESFQDTFQGNYEPGERLQRIGDPVIERLRKERPDLFARRRHTPLIIEVITDRELFIQEMLKAGAELAKKDIEDLKPEEIALTGESFEQTFQGNYNKGDKLRKIGDEVVEKLRKEKPDLFVRKRRGTRIVNTFADRKLFIQEMLKAGAELTITDIEVLKPEEIALSIPSLTGTFQGDYTKNAKLRRISDEVLERLRQENPGLFVKRLNKTRVVDAFTDRTLLIQEMLKAGAELKKR